MPNEPAEPLEPGTRNGDELLDRSQLVATANELGRLASSWVCNARLLGNVPAGEILQLCMEFELLAEESAALESKLSALEEPCVWTYDETHEYWSASCGDLNDMCFIEGSPLENEMVYCCYCRRPISEHREET